MRRAVNPFAALRRPRVTWAAVVPWLGFVAACLLPLLWNGSGKVTGDTADGLVLQPEHALTRAVTLWDSGQSFGAVVDRTYSATFPMAPFFWFTHLVGIPEWVAQRLWFAGLLVGAGVGVVKLMRYQQWQASGAWIAAALYVGSPYAISSLGTHSVVLLAWAGLPWLLLFTMSAFESAPGEEWKQPAKIGLVVAIVGGGNMSALLYVAVGPVLWIVYALISARTIRLQHAGAVAGRLLLCSIGVLAWKLSGVLARPRAEFAFISAHDPVDLVASAASPLWNLRGLGEWTFGPTAVYPTLHAARAYYTNPVLVLVALIPAGVALFAIARLRFNNRLFWVGLLTLGLVLSVGPGPAGHAQAFARLFRSMTGWDVGFPAMLPSARALPLVALAIAVCVGSAAEMLVAWRPEHQRVLLIGGIALALATVPSFIAGSALDGSTLRGDVEDYWIEAAAFLDEPSHDGFGVLEMPGMVEPDYEWGGMRTPISQSLVDRTVAVRRGGMENQPAVNDLLSALDDAVGRNELDPVAIAPLARLMGVDSIVVRSDTTGDADAAARWNELLSAAPEIGDAQLFGEVTDGVPRVAIFPVEAPLPLVRTANPNRTVVLSGTGAGLVSMANRGLLSGAETVVYAATLDDTRFAELENAPIVITASSRLIDMSEADLVPVDEAAATQLVPASELRSDRPLPYSAAGAEAFPVAEFTNGVRIRANSYGAPDVLVPASRPASAFDSRRDTAWRAGRGRTAAPTLTIDLPAAVTADRLVLQQVAGAEPITAVEVTAWPDLDDRRDTDVTSVVVMPGIAAESSSDAGTAAPTFAIPEGGYRRLQLEFRTTEEPQALGIALAEIEVLDAAGRPGFTTREELVVPDALATLPDSEQHPLAYIFDRWTDVSGTEVPEDRMIRSFTVDTTRSFVATAKIKHFDSPPSAECARPEIVLVDGEAVPLQIDLARFSRPFGPAKALAPIVLDRGAHTLEVVADDDCGLFVDSLMLSDRVGAFSGPPASIAAVNVSAAADTNAQYELSAPENTNRDVWLTSGASYDPDWQVTGTYTIDRPTLVNGFASGWYLKDLGASLSYVATRWTPQRSVNVSVIATVAVVLVLLAIVVVPRRRVSAVSLPGKELPRFSELRFVAVLVVLVFGTAAGAVPTLAAGLTVVVLERRPHLRTRLGWVGPGLLLVAALGQAVDAIGVSWGVQAAEKMSSAWIDAVGWSALAVAVTIALTTIESSRGSRGSS